MSALLGLAVVVLAIIGAIRVLRAIVLASRRTLAGLGRAMARLDDRATTPELESKPVPASEDTITQVASIALARQKRASKGSGK